jgi:hypothetical protein
MLAVMAYLREMPRELCSRCRRTAYVVVYSNADILLGIFCRTCGASFVRELSKQEGVIGGIPDPRKGGTGQWNMTTNTEKLTGPHTDAVAVAQTARQRTLNTCRNAAQATRLWRVARRYPAYRSRGPVSRSPRQPRRAARKPGGRAYRYGALQRP